MIPIQFSLFWAGGGLSYLRYLTFKSLRHFHPKAKIQVYVPQRFTTKNHAWSCEKQDFEKPYAGKDYLEELPKLDVEVVKVDYVGNPETELIFQADLFRWLWLKENGGFYLDTDQLILKPFDALPLEKEFVYSSYIEKQCGRYFPVGVLGLEKGSKLADVVVMVLLKIYTPNNYNSSGPTTLLAASKFMDLTNSYNAPSQLFYPINSSADVSKIYSGEFVPPEEAYALHWFGGHPLSQQFNSEYTEDFATTSMDSISKLSRQMGII